ncbi:MAG: hypothetical protein ACD_49C00070G0012 [uncultured bacterium (gcode 4)]|uniref:Uncharacterized protein n=1 Tax=uncultured bacterium (gcode 4) TaxID=1234023 RepID=K2BB55_9BACT|nr:MAG: hypothetical protein ACD_49C00070G0012 [uncultured bacterium (gcode 4)]
MGFSFKSLFWGNREKEVKKADLAKAKPVSKPVVDAQARVVDMYSRILPEVKKTPDIEIKKPEKRVIKFSPDLLKEHKLPVYNGDEEPLQFNPIDPRTCVREHLRVESNEIIDKHINVKTVNLSDPQIVSDDILSNISAGWLQIISSIPKEVWDKLSFDFFMWNDEFSLVWEVRSILTDPENNKRYWIQFIDPPKDQIRALNLIVWTAKLSKFTKENVSTSEIDLIS